MFTNCEEIECPPRIERKRPELKWTIKWPNSLVNNTKKLSC